MFFEPPMSHDDVFESMLEAVENVPLRARRVEKTLSCPWPLCGEPSVDDESLIDDLRDVLRSVRAIAAYRSYYGPLAFAAILVRVLDAMAIPREHHEAIATQILTPFPGLPQRGHPSPS